MTMYRRQLDAQPEDPTQPLEERRQAVGLGYDPERDDAPRVIAKGQGPLAEKIIQLAKANGIPIREDPLLTAALASIELDTAIPPELYVVIAEVFLYIYRLREQKVGK